MQNFGQKVVQNITDNSGQFSQCSYMFFSQVIADDVHTKGWWRGIVVSGVRHTNEVNARLARLVPGWVKVFGWVYHLGM